MKGAITLARRWSSRWCSEVTVYEHYSPYNHIKVVDQGLRRLLKFGGSVQSGMWLDEPVDSAIGYPDVIQLVWCLKQQMEHVLVIGLGGGNIPKRLLADHGSVQVDAVEVDAAVIDTAQRYFELPSEQPRLRVIEADGRDFIERSSFKYDAIILDAYFDGAMPYRLATREAFEAIEGRLTERGILAVNMVGSLKGESSDTFRSFYATLKSVFPEIYLFPEAGIPARFYQNIVMFAPRTFRSLNRWQWLRRAWQLRRRVPVARLPLYAASLWNHPVPTDDVPVFEDDRENPYDGQRLYISGI